MQGNMPDVHKSYLLCCYHAINKPLKLRWKAMMVCERSHFLYNLFQNTYIHNVKHSPKKHHEKLTVGGVGVNPFGQLDLFWQPPSLFQQSMWCSLVIPLACFWGVVSNHLTEIAITRPWKMFVDHQRAVLWGPANCRLPSWPSNWSYVTVPHLSSIII